MGALPVVLVAIAAFVAMKPDSFHFLLPQVNLLWNVAMSVVATSACGLHLTLHRKHESQIAALDRKCANFDSLHLQDISSTRDQAKDLVKGLQEALLAQGTELQATRTMMADLTDRLASLELKDLISYYCQQEGSASETLVGILNTNKQKIRTHPDILRKLVKAREQCDGVAAMHAILAPVLV